MTICMVIAQAIAIIWVLTLVFKSNYPAVLFSGSFMLFLIGLSFKIMHWAHAQLIIYSMVVAQIIAIVWLIFSLFKKNAKTQN